MGCTDGMARGLSAAAATVRAPRYVIWCARLFGRRNTFSDGKASLTTATFRGTEYLLKWRE